jgi:MFS family permease
MASTPAAANPFAFRTDSYAWYVVAVLCMGSVVSMLDRQVINLLVEPIKKDLEVSDTQIALLQGFAFAVFYAFMAVPLGRWADTGSRKRVMLFGILLFSAATFVCGLARQFWQLFIARMFVGVGEATLSPAGYSMLSDYFPRHQLGRAISLFTGTGFLGSGLALLLGGLLLKYLDGVTQVQLPVLGLVEDWQLAFMLACLPGLLFALLFMITVEEPPRSDGSKAVAAAREAAPFAEVWAYMKANARVLGPIFFGFSVLAAGQFALGSWIPSFFIRTYDWSAAEIGKIYGLYVMTLGTAGVIVGGWISDAWLARGQQDANLRVPLIAALLALPLVVAFALCGDATLSLILLAPLVMLGSMPFGAGTAAIPMVAPNRLRAQMVAFYLLIANLLGAGAGPWFVAAFTDYVLGDPLLIRYSIAIVGAVMLGLGAFILWLGLAPYRRVMSALHQEQSA